MKPTHNIPPITVLVALPALIHTARAAPPPDLIAAARAGDTAKAKKFLQTPGQANVRDERGNTALHWAALAGNEQLQDQVEDLEMPPLGKCERFPALTKDEIAKLTGWIAQGANWPQGATLHTPEK